ncbi:GNAT family N-acyltransferase [Sphingomonas sp.]|uniref:GNAT family N-acetyltransferase n=1 Tax=Sphingomonas sp. TaxID=28214 RepID=UPI001B046613|nr:GNAT family N-acyltransferase [Sphingomonas sp.]MBO9711696.1 GNAT family N-acetyltransferase [Sphingomonas sp.]
MISIASNGPARALRVRLAETRADVIAAQRLRWQVFYRDMGARAGPTQRGGLDVDEYDAVCDHLLVEDLATGSAQVVGTYRLLRQRVAEAHGGFYSAGEYALDPLLGGEGELLELGRSCVAPAYRDAGTIQLLWRGIADYLEREGISRMFGCASLPGTDPSAHAEALSYLHHHHLAPAAMRPRALAGRHVEMNRLPVGTYDPRRAMRLLPPLIKGYLRVGAMVGDGAVIDHQFNTVDVFLVVPVDAISARYRERFGAAA